MGLLEHFLGSREVPLKEQVRGLSERLTLLTSRVKVIQDKLRETDAGEPKTESITTVTCEPIESGEMCWTIVDCPKCGFAIGADVVCGDAECGNRPRDTDPVARSLAEILDPEEMTISPGDSHRGAISESQARWRERNR